MFVNTIRKHVLESQDEITPATYYWQYLMDGDSPDYDFNEPYHGTYIDLWLCNNVDRFCLELPVTVLAVLHNQGSWSTIESPKDLQSEIEYIENLGQEWESD